MKARHDEVHVIGSLDLVQSLLRLGLVDRLNLWQHPLLLGSGKHAFADGTVPTALHLTELVIYTNGLLQLTYETAGMPTYGEAAVGTGRRLPGPRAGSRIRPNLLGKRTALAWLWRPSST